MPEPAPAQLLTRPLGAPSGLVLAGEQRLELLLQELGVAAALFVQRIQPAHEQQVADLLDGREWVGDAAGPEAVPELVNLGAKNRCQHGPVIPPVVPILPRAPCRGGRSGP